MQAAARHVSVFVRDRLCVVGGSGSLELLRLLPSGTGGSSPLEHATIRRWRSAICKGWPRPENVRLKGWRRWSRRRARDGFNTS